LKKLVLTATTILAFATILSAQTVSKQASKEPPAPVTTSNAPLFIVLGSDDNTRADAFKWMNNAINAGTNKDGSKRYMSFYVNTDQTGAIWDKNNDLVDAAYQAYKAGHEIGNHTSTHLYSVKYGTINKATGKDDGERASLPTLKAEIQRVQDILFAAGIPREHQNGFRTPYLRYSDSTFTAMQEVGFLYDCSVNAATDNEAGTNYYPYTLSFDDGNGNFSPDNSADRNDWGKTSKIGKHEGLWELPCVRFAIAPQDIDYVKGVLQRKNPGEDYEDYSGYVTGLDYNMWNEIELDEDQTVRSWMETVNRSLAGNRAPVTIGIHSQYYFQAAASSYPKMDTPEKKQRAFTRFLTEASNLDNVWFVSGDMVIRWMQNPVSADQFDPENYRRPAIVGTHNPTKIRLSNYSVSIENFKNNDFKVGELTAVNLDVNAQHTYSILEGEDNFEIDGNILKFKTAKPVSNSGYEVLIKAQAQGAGSVEQDFKIWVDEHFDTDSSISLQTGWGKSVDNYGLGSEITITGSAEKLKLDIKLGKKNTDNDPWPYAGAEKKFTNALTGLEKIIVSYTSNRDINVGIGYWSAQVAFGYAVTLPKGTYTDVEITPDLFSPTYTEGTAVNRYPGSIQDALNFRGTSVSFNAIDYGEMTNLEITSLRFLGIPNKAVPQKTSISKVAPNARGAITLSGVSAGKLNLNVAKAGVYDVEIFAVNGKRLFSQKLNLNSGKNSVSLKGLAKGVGILRVSGLNANIEQKLMIK